MAVEQQLQYNTFQVCGEYTPVAAQRLTIPGRYVAYLAFLVVRYPGSKGYNGPYYFQIWRVSDGAVIATTAGYNSSDLPLSWTWLFYPLLTPLTINEEVRIGVNAPLSLLYHRPAVRYQNTDAKGGEFRSMRDSNGVWTDYETHDLTYQYFYSAGPPPEAPTVTTQAVTDIEPTTATGHGTITDAGNAPVTQHGVCWNTTGTPTIDDDKTQEGSAEEGAFQSVMTGLTAVTHYYVRAYATNVYGISYGNEVEFTTTSAVPPTVTTQATTGITQTKATGNGTIESIGDSPVTQHGHCWNTTGNPTIDNDKTQNGAGSIGAFTSDVTGLYANTLYYIRAYATNASGISYGAIVEFITSPLISVGKLFKSGDDIHYGDGFGYQRKFAATAPSGAISISGTAFCAVVGTVIGSATPGALLISVTKLHYGDANSDKREIEGVLI